MNVPHKVTRYRVWFAIEKQTYWSDELAQRNPSALEYEDIKDDPDACAWASRTLFSSLDAAKMHMERLSEITKSI